MSCASIPSTASSSCTASLLRDGGRDRVGGRNFRELVRELETDFPADKIHEALTRLLDRGYVLAASRSSAGAAAAYWASLGLSPQAVQDNFQACRVCIQSIDVQGAKELAAALRGLAFASCSARPI